MKKNTDFTIPALLIPLIIGVSVNLPGCYNNSNECRFEGLECPNANRVARSYQIGFAGERGDTVQIFDGERLVGQYGTDFNNLSPLDSIILLDNQ
jgi:hypothetical protein